MKLEGAVLRAPPWVPGGGGGAAPHRAGHGLGDQSLPAPSRSPLQAGTCWVLAGRWVKPAGGATSSTLRVKHPLSRLPRSPHPAPTLHTHPQGGQNFPVSPQTVQEGPGMAPGFPPPRDTVAPKPNTASAVIREN